MTDKPPPLNVVPIYPSNFRQVPETLRRIADEVEAGTYGAIGCAGLVLLGDRVHVFGMGPDSAAPSVALLLHAGHASLSRAVEDHGK